MNKVSEKKDRVVAIVGRPNVGKSALFNRIAGKRIAIVHDESGVTRDRLMREVDWDDEKFLLVDTGGVAVLAGQNERDPIEAGTRSQVDVALEDAAVAIFVVDVQCGVHPLDEEVARMLRKAGVPCVVAVNKCDLPQHEVGMDEFARFGFPLFPVSASHNHGVGDLMDAVLPHLPEAINETCDAPLRVAVVGRPNAGKSSYINRLLNEERVIVSDVAGTTRDAIDIPFTIGTGEQARHYTLIDTAGMRNRHKSESPVERFSLFRSEEAVRNADVVVLVMDPELGPTVQDKHIANVVQEAKKACVLMINKWDIATEKGMTPSKTEPVLREVMPFMSYCPVAFVSAKTGFNIRATVNMIDIVAAHTRTKLPTGLLNRTLMDATRKTVAPTRFNKRLKVYYAVQVGIAPIRIRLFVNDPKLVTKQYTDFMLRTLRTTFDLSGAPIEIFYRARERPDAATYFASRKRQSADMNSDVADDDAIDYASLD